MLFHDLKIFLKNFKDKKNLNIKKYRKSLYNSTVTNSPVSLFAYEPPGILLKAQRYFNFKIQEPMLDGELDEKLRKSGQKIL
jgi:hypothetical protein